MPPVLSSMPLVKPTEDQAEKRQRRVWAGDLDLDQKYAVRLPRELADFVRRWRGPGQAKERTRRQPKPKRRATMTRGKESRSEVEMISRPYLGAAGKGEFTRAQLRKAAAAAFEKSGKRRR